MIIRIVLISKDATVALHKGAVIQTNKSIKKDVKYRDQLNSGR